jgi:disulfide bond formation protein DsbB
MTIMPGERLRTERVSGLAIVFEIVLVVVLIHAVLLQEGMHLRPCLVSK